MKRKVLMLVTAVALFVSACGNSTGSASENAKKVKVDSGVFKLGQYKGLKVDKIIYNVTDANVDEEIDSMRGEYVDYKVVDRAAGQGDYVGFSLVSTVDGKEIEDFTGDGYGAYVGEEDFGRDFDAQLMGVVAGDKREFTVSYDEDEQEEAFAGKVVDFVVTINSVEEEVYPELTDEFVINNLGYDNVAALKAAVKVQLEEESKESAESTMRENLLQQVKDGSDMGKYSDELYQSCKETLEAEYMAYAEWFGGTTAQDVFDGFGMTDEDVEEEILDMVHMHMIVDGISKEEDLKVTDEEYAASLEEYAAAMGYEDTASLEAERGKDELLFEMLYDKVLNLIIDNAEVNEVVTDRQDETDDSGVEEIK